MAPPAQVTEPVPAEQALMLRIPGRVARRPAPGAATTVDGGGRGLRLFTPGSAILLEDTTGQGHSSRTVDGEVLIAVTQLSD